MRREQSSPCLSAVFVDYDNIYLSLKRRNEGLARRFAKDAAVWIKEIELGRLITPTHGPAPTFERRLVMNRCYGNPVPRRNNRDNSTDMSSFPFVRHNFLRAGFEIVDCPPLTAQLKNSSDIRMVMDIRDFLTHDTYFDEFIILSGDSDFTPVLHRLRAHARRTVIYANDYTAAPYTAICDGEIRENDLVALLMQGEGVNEQEPLVATPLEPDSKDREELRAEIVAQVVDIVRHSETPVPIETLADRAQRSLGHDKTVGTDWAGHGAFRTFLLQCLPLDIKLTEQAPYLAYEPIRHGEPFEKPIFEGPTELDGQDQQSATPKQIDETLPQETVSEVNDHPLPEPAIEEARSEPPPIVSSTSSLEDTISPLQQESQSTPQRQPTAINLQESIERIHEACQAPPLAPPEYLLMFDVMAAEINENGLSGAQTITNVATRAQQRGLQIRREDVRFVLDVVSEADPWFEQGASSNLFAGRFRNFVVARCRNQGLNLSAEELDLIDAWFAGGVLPTMPAVDTAALPEPAVLATREEHHADQLWKAQADQSGLDDSSISSSAFDGDDMGQLPRIVRSRLNG